MSRSYSAVHVHLVFATLERRPFLADPPLLAEMHAYLGGISNTLKCQSMIVGGVEDHVHILATQGKTVSLSVWVQELKRESSIWIKQRDPKLSQFAWQSGYGAHSVSNDDVAKIRRYIQNQEEHHRTVSFRDEFMELLREHGMEWDARDNLDE